MRDEKLRKLNIDILSEYIKQNYIPQEKEWGSLRRKRLLKPRPTAYAKAQKEREKASAYYASELDGMTLYKVESDEDACYAEAEESLKEPEFGVCAAPCPPAEVTANKAEYPKADAKKSPKYYDKYKDYLDAKSKPLEARTPQAQYAIDIVKGVTPEDLDMSFGEKLAWWLEQKHIKPRDFYPRANINTSWYSSVVNARVEPKKNMAMACAVGLRLNLQEAEDLLKTAGYAFSNSNLSDVIVKCYIEHGIWDINEINDVLFEKDLVPLGQRTG